MPSCPACYLRRVICVICGKGKPAEPSGVWVSGWWYCGAECLKSPRASGRMCKKHRVVLDRIKARPRQRIRKEGLHD